MTDTAMMPVCTADEDGHVTWRLNGHLHRSDGPAVISAWGDEEWWLDGCLHRADGPALVWKNKPPAWHDGCDWFLNGAAWPEGPEIMAEREKQAAIRARQAVLQGLQDKQDSIARTTGGIRHALHGRKHKLKGKPGSFKP